MPSPSSEGVGDSSGLPGDSSGLSVTGYNLMPTTQYVYDVKGTLRSLTGLLDVGAFEYGSGTGADVSSPSAVRDLRNR